MKKRGQITVFIILGIVILAVIGGFLAFRSGFIDTYLSTSRDQVKVPSEIAPVQNYLEFCLEESVRKGINFLGLQGGYLELETYDKSSADQFTNVLEVAPGYKVAYWYYEDLNKNGKIQAPSLSLMEEQLNEFVKRDFNSCLNNLDEFKEQGFEIDIKNIINPEIIIEKEFIDAVIRVPVNIKKNSVSVKISRHVVMVDSSFGKLYDKAKNLFEDENEGFWLENKTVEYLYSYTNELPHYDVEFTCKSLLWKKSEIAENYGSILELNVPYYMVRGSKFGSYYYGEPSLTWNADGDYSDVSVYFEYDRDWPFELDIQGSQGDSVISQPFPGGLPVIGFCVNNYNFVYSIKHPILITVSEDDEEFSFATQVVIRNNEPRKEIDNSEDIQYCGIRDVNLLVDVYYADESGTYDYLDEASVFYKCMNHVCYLGDTLDGRYSGKAPVCMGGELEIIKEGYKVSNVNYDTLGGPGEISVYVEELISFDYEFKVYDLNSGSLSGPRSLTSKESVVFELRDLSDNMNAYIGFYPDEDEVLELGPGLYQVMAKLINTGPANIEPKEVTMCKCPEVPLAGCLCGEETVNLEALSIEDVVTGGVEASFNIERGDLSRDKIVFYIINGGLPSTYDDLMITYDSAQISLGHGNSLEPSFENE